MTAQALFVLKVAIVLREASSGKSVHLVQKAQHLRPKTLARAVHAEKGSFATTLGSLNPYTHVQQDISVRAA